MASEVEICNLALAHLGESESILTISPPDGQPNSARCARFYPIARDTLLGRGWTFNTKRASLSQLSVTLPEWDYCYSQPSDCLRPVAVLLEGSTDMGEYGGSTLYAPQPFVTETLSDNSIAILTNVSPARLRYYAYVTDPTRFSPSFTTALSYLLASWLAGPVIKGDAGTAKSNECLRMMQMTLNQAMDFSANSRQEVPAANEQAYPWDR